MVLDDFEDIVDTCVEYKLKGKEYSEIRKVLKEEGLSDLEISEIIKETDKIYLSELINNKSSSKNAYFILGWIFIFFGLSVTILTYIKASVIGGGFYVIMYGPIFVGITMVTTTFKRKKYSPFNESKRNKWQRNY